MDLKTRLPQYKIMAGKEKKTIYSISDAYQRISSDTFANIKEKLQGQRKYECMKLSEMTLQNMTTLITFKSFQDPKLCYENHGNEASRLSI